MDAIQRRRNELVVALAESGQAFCPESGWEVVGHTGYVKVTVQIYPVPLRGRTRPRIELIFTIDGEVVDPEEIVGVSLVDAKNRERLQEQHFLTAELAYDSQIVALDVMLTRELLEMEASA